MEEEAWEWSMADPNQCWMEILQILQSGGFNDNLYRCRGHLKTKATVGNQPPSTETGLVQLPTGKVSQ